MTGVLLYTQVRGRSAWHRAFPTLPHSSPRLPNSSFTFLSGLPPSIGVGELHAGPVWHLLGFTTRQRNSLALKAPSMLTGSAFRLGYASCHGRIGRAASNVSP